VHCLDLLYSTQMKLSFCFLRFELFSTNFRSLNEFLESFNGINKFEIGKYLTWPLGRIRHGHMEMGHAAWFADGPRGEAGLRW
jgi:hypothetical protein